MKKLVFLLFTVVSFFANSQIVVEETKKEDLYKGNAGTQRLTKFTQDSVSTYAFYFRNAKYQHIVDYQYISFSDSSEVKVFFNYVIDVIDNKKQFQMKVGNKDVHLSKSMGETALILIDNGYCYVSKKAAIAIKESL